MYLVLIILSLIMLVALFLVALFMSGFTGESAGRIAAKSSFVLFFIVIVLFFVP